MTWCNCHFRGLLPHKLTLYSSFWTLAGWLNSTVLAQTPTQANWSNGASLSFTLNCTAWPYINFGNKFYWLLLILWIILSSPATWLCKTILVKLIHLLCIVLLSCLPFLYCSHESRVYPNSDIFCQIILCFITLFASQLDITFKHDCFLYKLTLPTLFVIKSVH